MTAILRSVGQALVAGLVLSIHPPLHAELVEFVRGGSVVLPVELDGENVRLLAPNRPYVFHKSDIRRMTAAPWPAEEWPERRTAALAGSATERFAAAWWALENGLTEPAVVMIRAASEQDPDHQPAARLSSLLDRLENPLDDPDPARYRDILDGEIRFARGKHVLLIHQHNEVEAAERLELLEQVVTTFYLTFAAQGFDLALPENRLVSIWIQSPQEYANFVQREGGRDFRSTQGYFHPTRRIVITLDSRSRDEHADLMSRNLDRKREIDRIRSVLPSQGRFRLDVSGEPSRVVNRESAERTLGRLERDVERQALLLELRWRATDLGVAAHEMVHLLVATSGLAPRHEAFPIWLHEGLAAQFEVVRGGRWAGVGRVNDLRLPDWRRQRPAPALKPLLRDEGFGGGYNASLYAQAWALVFFLRKEQAPRFSAFLDLLRTPEQKTTSTAGRHFTAFQSAFGADLERQETQWHSYMSSISDVRTRDASKPSVDGTAPRPSSR